MLFDPLLQSFLDKRSVAVLTRATLEHAFASEALDELFRTTATPQYQHTILFSRLVELLTAVVTRRFPSVHAAYRGDPTRLGASLSRVYDNLNHLAATAGEAGGCEAVCEVEARPEEAWGEGEAALSAKSLIGRLDRPG